MSKHISFGILFLYCYTTARIFSQAASDERLYETSPTVEKNGFPSLQAPATVVAGEKPPICQKKGITHVLRGVTPHTYSRHINQNREQGQQADAYTLMDMMQNPVNRLLLQEKIEAIETALKQVETVLTAFTTEVITPLTLERRIDFFALTIPDPVLHACLLKTKKQMRSLICDKVGALRFSYGQASEKLQRIVANFLHKIALWRQFQTEHSLHQMITSGGEFPHFDHNDAFAQKVSVNEGNQAIIAVLALCKAEEFQKAKNIVTEYETHFLAHQPIAPETSHPYEIMWTLYANRLGSYQEKQRQINALAPTITLPSLPPELCATSYGYMREHIPFDLTILQEMIDDSTLLQGIKNFFQAEDKNSFLDDVSDDLIQTLNDLQDDIIVATRERVKSLCQQHEQLHKKLQLDPYQETIYSAMAQGPGLEKYLKIGGLEVLKSCIHLTQGIRHPINAAYNLIAGTGQLLLSLGKIALFVTNIEQAVKLNLLADEIALGKFLYNLTPEEKYKVGINFLTGSIIQHKVLVMVAPLKNALRTSFNKLKKIQTFPEIASCAPRSGQVDSLVQALEKELVVLQELENYRPTPSPHFEESSPLGLFSEITEKGNDVSLLSLSKEPAAGVNPEVTVPKILDHLLDEFSSNILIDQASSKKEAFKIAKNFSADFSKKIKTTIESSSNFYMDYKLLKLQDGNYSFQMTKPGKVPGSKAIYYKKIDQYGKTIDVFKETFDPAGRLIHRKAK